MATKADLFNGPLIELGHRVLVDTGENVEAGRLLNTVYTQVVTEALQAGGWNFAIETIRATADTGVVPEFGYTEVFAKPEDWLRTIGVSQDEYFSFPLLTFYDDASFWSADNSPIYIRYVSNDTGLGFELSRWPAAFTRFVELELASRIAYRITQSEELKGTIDALRDHARRNALAQDAMNENQPKFPPPGSWTRARGGRGGRERGNRGSLIG